jgi:hypothetical protein
MLILVGIATSQPLLLDQAVKVYGKSSPLVSRNLKWWVESRQWRGRLDGMHKRREAGKESG